MMIYDRTKAGEWSDIRTDQGYKTEAAAELQRSRRFCFYLNHTEPGDKREGTYLDELFEGRLPQSSNLFSPIMIDRTKAMIIGENMFINHGLTVMGSGNVTTEDDVMIGPEAMVTKDVFDKMIVAGNPAKVLRQIGEYE